MRLAVLLLFATNAAAYVRTTSDTTGTPLYWSVRCIVMQPDIRGSQDLDIDTISSTLSQATRNWSTRIDACSSMRISAVPPGTLPPAAISARQDNIHAVQFRDLTWDDDPSIIAKTTVWHLDAPGSPNDGLIVDADIKLNGVGYTFVIEPSTTTPRDGTVVADLENTLTHELGHVLGLGHTCWDHISDTPPLDNTGNPIPDCGDPSLPTLITDATMYPYSLMPGDTSKRSLTDDDVAGVCQPYPPSSEAACFQFVQGGCSIGTARTSLSWLVVCVIFAALFRRRSFL
jgi:hypothetical protein